MAAPRCAYCASSQLRLVWDKSGMLLWCRSCYRLSELSADYNLADLPSDMTYQCRIAISLAAAGRDDTPEAWAAYLLEHYAAAARGITTIMIAAAKASESDDCARQWQRVLELLKSI